MFTRLLRALGAAIVLAALLVGVPLLLVRTVGNPLDQLPDLLDGDITDRVLIAVLGAVAYLAWAQFAVATGVEMVSALTRRRHFVQQITSGRGARVRNPLRFAANRRFARALVATALMIGSFAPSLAGTVAAYAATPGPAAAAVLHEQPTARPQLAGGQQQAPAARGPVKTVTIAGSEPRTWWDLADKYLGAGDRWPEIWQLNAGSHQPGGAVLDSPGVIKSGWTIIVPDRNPAAAPQDERRTITARPGDTLSEIADRQLGDAARWPELAELSNIETPDQIEVGQQVTLPAATTDDTTVTVRPGDTLSEIAAEHHLPSWTSLWESNQGRLQPDGQHLVDPDLIEPGWTIQIPATQPPTAASQQPTETTSNAASHRADQTAHRAAEQSRNKQAAEHAAAQAREKAAAERAHEKAIAEQAAEQTRKDAAEEKATAAQAQAKTQQAAAAAGKAQEQQRPPHVPGRVHHPATVVERPADPGPSPAADMAAADHASSLTPAFLAAGGGMLLASLVAGALWSRRRRQFRHRRSGHTIVQAPGELARTERGLLSVADPEMADIGWLDQALRGLVHRRNDTGEGELPDLTAVRMSGNLLELHLAAASTAPQPWTASADGTVWTLRRGEDTGYRAEARAFQYAPYPMLVSIGHTPAGDRWLLDLEHMAAVMLTGDEERGLNLARFLAAELAHNTWSELLQVTLVGFGAEMADLNVERVTQIPDAREAIAAVHRQAESVPDAAAVLGERAGDVAGEPWTPHVLLVAGAAVRADRAGVDELVALLRSQSHRSSIALILDAADSDLADDDGQDDEQVWRVHLTTDGILEVPRLGLELVAEQLPEHEARDLARLLVLAAQTDDGQQMPAARGEQPWDEYADAAGLLRDQHGRPHLDESAIRIADPGEAEGTSVLPLATDAYVQAAPTTAEDLQTLAPEVDPQVCQQILLVSDGLDADLAAWADLECPRPKVQLLGPVEVRAQGKLPADKPRRAWNCEVVAFLASRPQGVTAAEFGTAMWPHDPDIEGKTKLRQSISIARKWLGMNSETGREHIPSNPGVPGQLYRLEGALVDAELFRRLRIRGAARGQEGILDLQAALGLVSGPPFHQLRVGSYSWLADTPLHHEYTAMIADTAHTVAVHFHAVGDPLQAAEAAKVALLAGGPTDAALLDLVEACYAMGQDGEAARWLQELMVKHDAEVEEELPRRTYDVLLRKGWLGKAG